MFKAEQIYFEYTQTAEEDSAPANYVALNGVDAEIQKGEFVAVVGRNGSGKSTFAKHLNALLSPTSGTLWVNGAATSKEENIWQVRKSTGMVFQNPDNQIIASVVEEDVAFGPENLGVEPGEIRRRVDGSLAAVRMADFAKAAPHILSGGQKQRVAIAGVLAMRPDCIVFDEATAMLDPLGRSEVLETVAALNGEGITIILITHFMEEVVIANRVFVMNEGVIEMDGSPREIFGQSKKLRELGLDVPHMTALAHELADLGVPVSRGVLTVGEMLFELTAALKL
ncbi:MAG: energy-coupling factor transporter ATPase [Defluviitaleaceae bacterium]|nr:energy-coupling factor transporter ATPase [Defluviitaleaceae bacterium]